MKLLIVGPRGQDKAAFSQGGKLLCGAQDKIKDMMKAGLSHGEMLEALMEYDEVTCDEVGCGVVPIDPFERLWREEVGRLCCDMAEDAETVVRVVCGIGQPLKGGIK